MRSQNRKVKVTKLSLASAGRISCLGLLVLGIMLIGPVELSGTAFAEEGNENGVADELAAQAEENAPAMQSETLTSGVKFSFSEPVGTSSMTPVTVEGASALYTVQARVDITNSAGYTVHLGSNKSELVGRNYGVTISAVPSSTSYEGMPVNTWGYSVNEGTVAGTIFSAMPAYIRGTVIGENKSGKIKSDSKTFTLAFAAHIGRDKPADTYENQVTLSVVSSPLEIIKLEDITDMQEMTSEVCEETATGSSKQLKDRRDGKYYWVTKLADNKCWMTQNLDLDLNVNTTPLTSATSDVVTNWTPKDGSTALYTATEASSSTILANNTGQGSWDLGDYRIIDPAASSNCGAKKNSAADCPAQFDSYPTPTTADNAEPAHYIIGNYYQWNAATAGTGGTITSGRASGSICPKGWKLPESNYPATDDFGQLLSKYSVVDGQIDSMTILTSAPLYFVRGGGVNQNSNLFRYGGYSGYYWSSTPVSSGTEANILNFLEESIIYPTNNGNRQFGFSVRCVAR